LAAIYTPHIHQLITCQEKQNHRAREEEVAIDPGALEATVAVRAQAAHARTRCTHRARYAKVTGAMAMATKNQFQHSSREISVLSRLAE